MRVALATCAEIPSGFHEDDLAADLRATWAVWDDPTVAWERFDVVVVRSVWNADQRRDEFVEWTRRVDGVTRLLNPAPVLAWNTDKRYLAELPAAGLPTVTTRFLAPGHPLGADVLHALQDPVEIVVKPAQSAGSRDTARFATGDGLDGAAALTARIQGTGKVAMVQPYLPSVDTHGETALLYFGGAYSHAIGKGQILKAGAEPFAGMDAADPVISDREPSHAERALGDRVISWLVQRFGTPLAYARVDLLDGPGGRPVIIELELTEPQLYLPFDARATGRLASAIRALAR